MYFFDHSSIFWIFYLIFETFFKINSKIINFLLTVSHIEIQYKKAQFFVLLFIFNLFLVNSKNHNFLSPNSTFNTKKHHRAATAAKKEILKFIIYDLILRRCSWVDIANYECASSFYDSYYSRVREREGRKKGKKI